jgi:hypothetical protein
MDPAPLLGGSDTVDQSGEGSLSKFRYVSYGQVRRGGGDHGGEDGNYCSNEVVTAKYTAANFTFKFLMEEFSKVANVYFLVVCCLQVVPQIR